MSPQYSRSGRGVSLTCTGLLDTAVPALRNIIHIRYAARRKVLSAYRIGRNIVATGPREIRLAKDLNLETETLPDLNGGRSYHMESVHSYPFTVFVYLFIVLH